MLFQSSHLLRLFLRVVLDRNLCIYQVKWEAPNIDGFEIRLEDPLTLVTAVSKKSSINNLFSKLNNIGINVKSMRNESNRLEELFIEMIKK